MADKQTINKKGSTQQRLGVMAGAVLRMTVLW